MKLSCNDFAMLKLSVLKQQLKLNLEHFGTTSFRCIIFCNQRLTAYLLTNFLNRDDALQKIGISAAHVTARGVKLTPTLRVPAHAARSSAARFRSGEINVLVTTSTEEEGLDASAANLVVLHDRLEDAAELCQRFGRKEGSKIVLLEGGGPVAELESACGVEVTREAEVEVTEHFVAQRRKEIAARPVLDDVEQCGVGPAASLHIYVQKTKAFCEDKFHMLDGLTYCELKYETCLRSVRTIGEGTSKKESKFWSSLEMLNELRKITGTKI